jgi:hypothetical protein
MVVTSDIATTATPLKTAVAHSLNEAFQGQRKPDEQVFILPCRPTVTSDHQPGQEAISVNVTVSQTCNAVAYNNQEAEKKPEGRGEKARFLGTIASAIMNYAILASSGIHPIQWDGLVRRAITS